MKNKVMILFPEGNFPYSPTTLNLVHFLAKHFEVFLLTSGFSDDHSVDTSLFTHIPLNLSNSKTSNNILFRIVRKVRRKLFPTSNDGTIIPIQDRHKFELIAKHIRNIKPFTIIAIDLFALFCCKRLDVECIFLSLEIPSESIYLNSLSHSKIEYVIIQSSDRYEYLFKGLTYKPPCFILPNTPVFKYPEKRTIASNKLIYNGYIWSAFGPQFCLSFVVKYPEFELHLKGNRNGEELIDVYFPYLKNSDHVFIDERYLQKHELDLYLQNFSIGFCFYNFSHPFIQRNAFNYETGPSGKLYAYLGMGLPVICSKIKAFKIVEEFEAGILIEDYSPDSIKAAVDKILANYSFFSDNALKLAEQNCFAKHIGPIIDYLIAKPLN